MAIVDVILTGGYRSIPHDFPLLLSESLAYMRLNCLEFVTAREQQSIVLVRTDVTRTIPKPIGDFTLNPESLHQEGLLSKRAQPHSLPGTVASLPTTLQWHVIATGCLKYSTTELMEEHSGGTMGGTECCPVHQSHTEPSEAIRRVWSMCDQGSAVPHPSKMRLPHQL